MEMDTDHYAERLIVEGIVVVDEHQGTVWNTRRRRMISIWPQGKRDPYPCVYLPEILGEKRHISVHRLIAIKMWGADAIRGKEVSHIDGDKARSVIENLQVLTPRAHRRFDITQGTYQPSRPKPSWPPCAVCGTPDGTVIGTRVTPMRIAGTRFGITGQLCKRCYSRYSRRVWLKTRAPRGG
jgi:hypothetical protein